MSKKPTYEELKQKVIELEKEVKKGKQADKELRDIKQKFKIYKPNLQCY